MLYSYDIFDTIIYRCVPKSTDIFYLMENDPRITPLWPKSFPLFSKCRKRSEFWARRKNKREINIEDIYRELKKKVSITNSDIDKLINLEYIIEQEQSFLNNSVLTKIKKHIQSDDKVILISDMYWHEREIRNWLVNKDGIFNDIEIYVSCDFNAKKSKGKLFQIIAEKQNISYQEWTHIGDNRISDGKMPHNLGINTVIVPKSVKYDFENHLKKSNINLLNTYGLIARARNSSNGEAFDLGASVAGPMVYQYVDWVIQTAITKQIEKLYFVMRDGYILKQVADNIIAHRRLGLKTALIFGSRVAWRFPEITIDKLHRLSVWEKSNWIFRDPALAYVPFEKLGVSRKELDSLFGKDFSNKKCNSFKDFKILLEQALKNKEFTSKLKANVKIAGENLYKYLLQTINFSESFAFVDTNSTGKTQADLIKFLGNREKKESTSLKFFYHTYLGDLPPDMQNQFVFNSIDSSDDRRFPEAFFRAPFNQCYGYKRQSGEMVPKFQQTEKCSWNYSFNYDEYLKGILAFVNVKEENGQNTNVNEYVDMLFKVVNFEFISKDEIRQVAHIPFNPDIKGNEILDFYPEISVKAIFHPFSQLIYYPKGSYYNAGKRWILVYKILYKMVSLKRRLKKRAS